MDIFCKIIKGEAESICPYEDDIVKCIMDANPNSPGHLLIMPKKHIENFMDMDDTTLNHINKVAKEMANKMMNNYPGIDGIQLIVNYGKPQFVKHYHLHLIPTYHNGKPELSQKDAAELLKK